MKKIIWMALSVALPGSLWAQGQSNGSRTFAPDSTVDVQLYTNGPVTFAGAGSVAGAAINLFNKTQKDSLVKRAEQKAQNQFSVFTKKEDRGKSHSSARIAVGQKFNLNFQTATGAVSLTDVEGNVKGRVESGAVTVTRGKGKMAVNTDQGDITVTESEASGFVMTRSGNVTLQDLRGPLTGITQKGKVTYKTTSAYFNGRKATPFDISFDEADIDIDFAPEGGRFLLGKGNINARKVQKSLVMVTDEGNLTAAPVSTGLRAKTRKGKVSVTVAANSNSTEPIVIENHDGDVELTVPINFAGNFVISLSQTKNLGGSYRVSSFLELGNTTPNDIFDPKTKTLAGRETQISQKVRNGTRPVRIRAVNGNVFIKRG